jgi:hypothetical protein
MIDPRLNDTLEILAQRWKCQWHETPGTAGLDFPNLLFTRAPSVSAIGAGHIMLIEEALGSIEGVERSPEFWERAKFLSSAMAFVLVVKASDGHWFCTISDFENGFTFYEKRERGIDSPAAVVIPSERFKVLKPEGAKIGPGSRSEAAQLAPSRQPLKPLRAA